MWSIKIRLYWMNIWGAGSSKKLRGWRSFCRNASGQFNKTPYRKPATGSLSAYDGIKRAAVPEFFHLRRGSPQLAFRFSATPYAAYSLFSRTRNTIIPVTYWKTKSRNTIPMIQLSVRKRASAKARKSKTKTMI